VPDAVVARAGLPRGERVRAAAQAADGTWLLGTAAALVVVPPRPAGPNPVVEPERVVEPVETSPAAETIPWERVEQADWDRDTARLRVSEVGEFGQVRPVHQFTLSDPGPLLPMVRERVTASVVLQRRVTVSGRKGFSVVARRSPTGAGGIGWAYEFDVGVEPDDPEVRRLADAALHAAEEELGL
jgi:hypothetical protein